MQTVVKYQNFSSSVDGDLTDYAVREQLKTNFPEIQYCSCEITYSEDRETKTMVYKTKSGTLG